MILIIIITILSINSSLIPFGEGYQRNDLTVLAESNYDNVIQQ